MDSGDRAVRYVLGHSDQELERLGRQGELFAAETREVLRRAGIGPGMSVLIVGCGAGDDALIAAELVGPTGSVTGIDRADAALAFARTRAEKARIGWLRFEQADILGFDPPARFDAVVGRFILLHVADAVGALKRIAGFARPGGTLAFVEMDIDEVGAVPELPLLTQCVTWVTETYRRVGVEPNMGRQLYATFRAAGLEPHLTGSCRVESGPNSIAYSFAAQTLASLVPMMEKLGIASAADIGIDTFAERMRQQTLAGDHCIFMPRLIGAWATLPVSATG